MHWYGRRGPVQPATIDLYLEEQAQRFQVHALAEVRPIFAKLQDWMTLLGFPRQDIFAVTLALHEAATNAFRHGNRGDPSKYVQISYLVTPAEVWVEVQDQGRGFDPAQVPDPLAEEILDRPGGRGLFLMRAYMNWVGFNQEGNRVTLCRRRRDL